MDVRCERCRAQYVFDDEQVTPSGLTVQCTNCGHVFKVKKKELVVTVPVKPGEVEGEPLPATAAAPRPGVQPAAAELEPERPREWRVRQSNGNVFTFRELTTLQKWIVEQKVSRDDEISLSGDQWKRLGNIAELASFFQVVEAAEKAKVSGAAPAVTPLPLSMPVYGVAIQPPGIYPPPPTYAVPAPAPAPDPPPFRAPSVDVDLGLGQETEGVVAAKKGRRGRTATLVVFLALAVGAAAYVVTPRLLESKPPPESLAVPITIDVTPEGSGAQAPGPGQPSSPAPVPAPEPVVEPSVHPPDPEVKPAAPAQAVPKGPKALLAQAARLRRKGNVESALDLYGRVADAEPENAEALTGRGLCYLDLSRYGPAEASFQAALAADPNQADALLGLAETYRWQGKKADAITNYEKYLERYPDGEEANVARNALEELRK